MKQLKIAILGQGRSGRDIHGLHLKNDTERFKVVAVVDQMEVRKNRAANEFGCDVYDSYKDILDRKDIDLVVNALPSHFHYEVTKDLLQHGFNVLCEKPFTPTVAMLDDLVNIAKENNVALMTFQQSRFAAYFEKVNGTNPRAKFRIRIYNNSDKVITLEKKVKSGELTQKLQARLTREEYEKIIAGDIDWMLTDGRGVVAELYAQMRGYSLKPKTLVEYTRMPFIYDPGNVRVTIDMSVRSGIFSNNLFDPTPLVPTGELDVLEVKYDAYLPDIIRYLVSPVSRDRQSFSKYEICRKFG